MRHFSIILLVLTLLFSSACQQQPREFNDSFLVFGTVINVTLLDVDEKLATESFRQIREDLAYMHRVWHVWEPGPLMRVNQLLETTNEFSAAPSVIPLIKVAQDLSTKSQHLFNPAIGKLIALWGFHSHQQPQLEPDDAAIQVLLKQHPTMQDIKINGVRMKSDNAAVKIDLGGVAKGFAIDRLLSNLKQQGIQNALIDMGGDIKVIGRHHDRAWIVAIRDPRPEESRDGQQNKTGIIASLDLRNNEAAFTSGDYERYLKNKNNHDKHLHHIIDPRTGYPATGTQSVTVLHEDAATADAAATAIFIAGPTQWIEIAKAMNIKHVMLIDAKGKIHISSAMEKRVKFEQVREIIERAEL